MRTLKKLALLPLLFCGLLATVACDRNNDNDNNENGDRLLPSRIFSTWECEYYGSETWGFNFFYDNQNRITEVREFERWEEDGKPHHWEFAVWKITYSPNGTIASIVLVYDGEEEWRTDFSHSRDTITAVHSGEMSEGAIDQFIVNDRGQMVRFWSKSDYHDWNMDFTYNENGNLTRLVTWSEGTDERIRNFEYSPTVRAVFRNITTPEWALLHYIFDAGSYPMIKHGFMPTRIWSDSWQETFTYSVENGWVKTKTIQEESIGSSVATKGMRSAPRRSLLATKSSDDYGRTFHFEYENAR